MVLMAAICLLGCQHDPSIVGKWSGDVLGQTGNFEFKDDSTVAITAKLSTAGIELGGRYKIDGKHLTINFDKAEAQGVPPAFQPQVDAFKKQIINKAQDYLMTWKNDDELDLATPPPETKPGATPVIPTTAVSPAVTLHRQKEGA